MRYICYINIDILSNYITLNDINELPNDKRVNLIGQLYNTYGDQYIQIFNLTENYDTFFNDLSDFVFKCNQDMIDFDNSWCIIINCDDDSEIYSVSSKRNIDKYIEEAQYCDEGRYYRNSDYKNAKDDEIVYISDYSLSERLNDAKFDLTDAELIDKGIAETKRTIRDAIKWHFDSATNAWIDKHDLVNNIIESCHGKAITTEIYEISEDDEVMEDYPKEW